MSLRTCLAAFAAGALLVGPAIAAEPKMDTDQDKTLYALGMVIAQNLGTFNLSAAELELVKAGLTDAVLGKEAKVDIETFGPKIQNLAQERQTAAGAVEKVESDKFLTKAATEKGAKKTASGLIYTEIAAGSGPQPKSTDKVKVHYHGTLRSGEVFDSSVQRKEPATFALNQVVPCWTEGVQMMKVGGKAKLVCPPDLAYGDRGAGAKIKPGAALTFEVELLEIVP